MLLSLWRGLWKLYSGSKAWQQATLPVESSHWPRFFNLFKLVGSGQTLSLLPLPFLCKLLVCEEAEGSSVQSVLSLHIYVHPRNLILVARATNAFTC